MSDLEYLNTMGIRAGKTTAICKAAKEIGATVVVHSREEALRVEREHGVKAVDYNKDLRGSRGPYLVDTCAVSFYASKVEFQIRNLEKKLEASEESCAKLLEALEFYANLPGGNIGLIGDRASYAIAEHKKRMGKSA